MMTASNSNKDNAKDFCYTESDKSFLAPLEAKKIELNKMLEEKTESDPSNVVMALTGAAGAIVGTPAIEFGGPIWGTLGGVMLGDALTVSKDEVVNDLADLDAKFKSIDASCELLANAMQNVDQNYWPAISTVLRNEELKVQALGNTDPAAIVEHLNTARVNLTTCINQPHNTNKTYVTANCPSATQQSASPQVDSGMSQ